MRTARTLRWLLLLGLSVPNPFAAPAMRSFLATRGGDVTAAVEDLSTGHTAVYRPGIAEQTASIIKVDILATLLRERGPLSGADAGVATGMIERSDNDDATRLWDEAGGAGAVGAFDGAAGMADTAPNPAGYWGLSWTTALDQVRLLRQLVGAHTRLSRAEQDYALGLMEHVEPGQNWGISGGVPGGADVALKNGWLPVSGGWQVNSIGRVKGHGSRYLLAVLTREDPTEAYGIATIAGISARIWTALQSPGIGRWQVRARRHRSTRDMSG